MITGAWLLWAAGAWTAQAEGAAATSAGAARDEVQALRERAAAFWAARVAEDFRAQWELLEPRFKGRVSAEEYRTGRGNLRYLAYQVEEATVDGAFATVKVRVLAQPILLAARGQRIPPQAALVDDPWIRIGGVWYRRWESEGSGPPQGPRP